MPDDMRICSLDPGHWPERIQDISAVRASAYEAWNGPRTPEQRQAEATEWLARIAQWRNPVVLLAEDGPEAVGYLLAYERDPGDMHIWHIGVRPAWQRRGIGRQLLRECEAGARAMGCQVLTVTTYNRFRGMLILLLQEGFDIEGVTWVTGAKELRLLLRKELKQ